MNFIGKCKTYQTQTGGEYTIIMINPEDILSLFTDAYGEDLAISLSRLINGAKVNAVRLKLAKSKKTGERFICVDTWKPDPNYKRSESRTFQATSIQDKEREREAIIHERNKEEGIPF